jgi:malonyl-CoA/methylmalonyl-CoA synthetase
VDTDLSVTQKGVLLPESVITAQARSLLQAWEYSSSDYLLHVLPLHHIHGTINAIYTPLFAGSAIEFMFPFNADAVWRRFAAPFLPVENGHQTNGNGYRHDTATSRPRPITFFTAVPTIYSRLLNSHKTLPPDVQRAARTALSPTNLRLAISGSAALPTPVQRAWVELSGAAPLLERYGMTEVGMALSCGLDPADRVDGSVGWPLPGVEARLVDLDTQRVLDPNDPADLDRPGEIQLRGPTIFTGYWRNPEATAKEFVYDEGYAPKATTNGTSRNGVYTNGTSTNGTSNGNSNKPWFRTGDVAVRRPAPPGAGVSDRPSQRSWARGDMFFVLGRRSADIIKSGGEKVSALEVERELLALPNVAEAAVVAVPSGRWGQKVGAVVVLNPSATEDGQKAKWSPLEMRRALKGRLAAYKIPQVLRVVDKIPRNAMGKVNKKTLVREVFADEFSEDEL